MSQSPAELEAGGPAPLVATAKFLAGRRAREGGAAPTPPLGRVPRVARLMALAIRFDHLIQTGAVSTQAELAAVGHITRARVTQIMNLLHLAPDLQEAILYIQPVRSGRDLITEHELRPIAALVHWDEQRRRWRELHIHVD